jgi:SAM-dependent methyltransferase
MNDLAIKLRAVDQRLCDDLGERLATDRKRAASRAMEDITFDNATDSPVPMGFTKHFAIMHAICGGDLAARTILDIGCGGGGCMAQAYGLGMLPTGIDIYGGQAESRNAAQRLLSAYGMSSEHIETSVRYGDITQPLGDLAASFDFTISLGMLEHIPDTRLRQSAVMNMMRALKPGGVMILLCGPNRWCPVDIAHYGPRFPFYHWLPNPVKARYMRYFIRPRRPDLNDVQAAPEFLSGVRVSEIITAITQVEPDATIVHAFPLLTRVAVTRAWLRRRSIQALVGGASRALTRFGLEPSIVILAQRPDMPMSVGHPQVLTSTPLSTQ